MPLSTSEAANYNNHQLLQAILNERIHPAEVYDWPLCEALAGPRPTGDWGDNPIAWIRWEAKWRAGVRRIRAEAVLVAIKQ